LKGKEKKRNELGENHIKKRKSSTKKRISQSEPSATGGGPKKERSKPQPTNLREKGKKGKKELKMEKRTPKIQWRKEGG